MKILPYIIGLILLANVFACQRKTTYPLAMQQAENLMNTRPDSALYLLQNMADNVSTLPEEAQMYYHLLTIQAKDKQYITHTSDSLINCIVEFYEDSGDKERLMLAYYYLGRVYRDMNDAPRALKSFQKVLDLNFLDKTLLAKTYSQMGYLFMHQGLYDEVIQVNRKAITVYKSKGKANKISYFLRDIARMYDAKNMPDSAMYYYKGAYNMALQNGDSARYYGIWGELGGFYYKTGKIDEAKQILKKLEHSTYIRNKSHVYSTLGNLYYDLEKWDSAHFYKMKVLKTGSLDKVYNSYIELAKLESRKGQYQKANYYWEIALELSDSIHRMTQTESIAKINSLYNYQHTEEENVRLELEKEKNAFWNLFFCSCSLCMFALGGIIILFYKRKKEYLLSKIEEKRKQNEQKYKSSLEAIKNNQQKITELENSLKAQKTDNDKLQQKLAEVQKEKLKAQNEAIRKWNEEQKLLLITFKSSEIYKELLQASIDETFNLTPMKHPDKWMIIQKNIDSIYPDFTERLCKLCPSLSDRDLQICYLTKINIAPSGISRVLKLSRQAITNTRKRIMQKVEKFSKNNSDFDHFIEEF